MFGSKVENLQQKYWRGKKKSSNVVTRNLKGLEREKNEEFHLPMENLKLIRRCFHVSKDSSDKAATGRPEHHLKNRWVPPVPQPLIGRGYCHRRWI